MGGTHVARLAARLRRRVRRARARWLEEATPAPDAEILAVLRGPIAHLIGEAYPRFVQQVFPDAA
jgi:hypothetical protein